MLKSFLVLVGAAVLLPAAADAADAAERGARTVGFTQPAKDTLVRSASVPVRVEIGAGVQRVRVFAGRRDITRRFTRSGRVLKAHLPRSMFTPGTNRLLVQAKARNQPAGAASVSFVLPGAKPTGMRTTHGTRAAATMTAGPAGTRGHQPTSGQVPVSIKTKAPTFSRLLVNGRRVEDLRAKHDRTHHTWLVSARDGLKPGRNRFVAETWDAKGRRSVKRWTVTRDRTRPLTEAGPRERRVEPHRWSALDGSKSRATRRGPKLRYTWRVVSAPKGAKAELRGPTRAKPRFRTDTPGIYQVALRATETSKRARAAAAATSEDVITLDASATLGKSGLYVDTSLDADGALTVNGQAYPPTSGALDSFVQLDPMTLAPKWSGTHAGANPQPDTITIGAWKNVAGYQSPGPQWGSAIWIGTELVASNTTTTDPGAGSTTDLHGWLKPAGSRGPATWVGSDMLQVKTRRPTDTPTTNTIEIGPTAFTQTLPAGATGGWHLVMLDHDGTPIWNELFALTGNATADAATQDQLAATIDDMDYQVTFLLQAFGTVPAVDSATALANLLQSSGGRADVLDRFNGTADTTRGVYALIFGDSDTSANTWSAGRRAVEASFERTGSTGSLTSLLVRDGNANSYVPLTSDSGPADPAGTNRYSLLPLVYSAPHDWTSWIRVADGSLRAPSAAESLAFADLLAEVKNRGWVLSTTCPNAPDLIRGSYCTTDASETTVLFTRVATMSFDAQTAGSRYTEQDWSTVHDSLSDELGDASNLRTSLQHYQALFGTTTSVGLVDAATLGDAIRVAIKQDVPVSTEAQTANLIGALSGVAAQLPEVGDAFTFIASAFSLGADVLPSSSPQVYLDEVQITQDNAAAELATAYQNASSTLSDYADMLVADPVRLQQGTRFLLSNDPTTDTDSASVVAAEYATQQWLWGTLLSTTYSAWVVPKVFGTNPTCVNSANTRIGRPWNSLQPSGRWASAIGTGTGHTVSTWLLGLDTDTQSAGNSWGWQVNASDSRGLADVSLPGSITDPLFGRPVSAIAPPSVATNAGAVMPYFALDYLKLKYPPQMARDQWGQNPNTTGCEPYEGIPSL